MTQTLIKKTPLQKRLDFIAEVGKPINDRAKAMLLAKSLGQDLPDLTVDEFKAIAQNMINGQILGRTDRWKNACAAAAHEIKVQEDSGEAVDLSFARWAVVQGSVWMCHAAD